MNTDRLTADFGEEPLRLYECKRNKRPVVQIEACNSGLGPS